MTKKPKYYWLSLLAFIFLYADTTRRTMFSRQNRTFWPSARWNGFKLFALYQFLIPTLYLFVVGSALGAVANQFGINAHEGSALNNIFDLSFFLLFYLCGVYITYRHDQWRKDELPHLV